MSPCTRGCVRRRRGGSQVRHAPPSISCDSNRCMRSLPSQPASLVIALLASSIAGATFLLPLAGIHRLLVAEKTRRLAEQSRRMNAPIEDLQRRMDRRQLRLMDDLYKALATPGLARA